MISKINVNSFRPAFGTVYSNAIAQVEDELNRKIKNARTTEEKDKAVQDFEKIDPTVKKSEIKASDFLVVYNPEIKHYCVKQIGTEIYSKKSSNDFFEACAIAENEQNKLNAKK